MFSPLIWSVMANQCVHSATWIGEQLQPSFSIILPELGGRICVVPVQRVLTRGLDVAVKKQRLVGRCRDWLTPYSELSF